MMPFALPPAETHLPFDALVRGWLPLPARFAQELQNFLGVQQCVLAANARTLLYLLLCALRDQRDQGATCEVLLPGYTCYSVAAAVVKAGLRVQLYDLEPRTLQPDMEDVRRKINPATLAVIGQHLLGVQSDIAQLASIARQHGAWCIEDSAQALVNGQVGGAAAVAADFTLFSFGRGKSLPLGGGGALVGKETHFLYRMAEYLQSIKPQTANPLLPFAIRWLSWPRLYWVLERLPLGLGRTVYDPEFRVAPMPMLYQRIGIRALAGLKQLNRHRIEISRAYDISLGGSCDHIPAHVRFPILVEKQDKVAELAWLGVRRLYPLALCDLPPLVKHLVQPGLVLHGAKEIARRLVTLPTHRTVDNQCARKICRHLQAQFDDFQLIGQGSAGHCATSALKMDSGNVV